MADEPKKPPNPTAAQTALAKTLGKIAATARGFGPLSEELSKIAALGKSEGMSIAKVLESFQPLQSVQPLPPSLIPPNAEQPLVQAPPTAPALPVEPPPARPAPVVAPPPPPPTHAEQMATLKQYKQRLGLKWEQIAKQIPMNLRDFYAAKAEKPNSPGHPKKLAEFIAKL